MGNLGAIDMTSVGGKAVGGYAAVHGLRMYYEIEGTGEPLVVIPPAFGFAGAKSLPGLAQHHSVITVDLQGHGRTADIPERAITFDQHVEDVIGLLNHLGITQADFFGESFGGVIATMIAIRHPGLVRRVATYGATFGSPPTAVRPDVLAAKVSHDSRGIQYQRERYEKVAPDPDAWPRIWGKVASNPWGGFSNAELASIEAPILIAVGDHDFVRLEHALETFRLIPHAELAIIPDAGHFVLFSEPERVIPMVDHFLRKPAMRLPFVTAEVGYHPGETR